MTRLGFLEGMIEAFSGKIARKVLLSRAWLGFRLLVTKPCSKEFLIFSGSVHSDKLTIFTRSAFKFPQDFSRQSGEPEPGASLLEMEKNVKQDTRTRSPKTTAKLI